MAEAPLVVRLFAAAGGVAQRPAAGFAEAPAGDWPASAMDYRRRPVSALHRNPVSRLDIRDGPGGVRLGILLRTNRRGTSGGATGIYQRVPVLRHGAAGGIGPAPVETGVPMQNMQPALSVLPGVPQHDLMPLSAAQQW